MPDTYTKFSVDVGVIENVKKLKLQCLGKHIIQDRVVQLENKSGCTQLYITEQGLLDGEILLHLNPASWASNFFRNQYSSWKGRSLC